MERAGAIPQQLLELPWAAFPLLPGHHCMECHGAIRVTPCGEVCELGHGGAAEEDATSSDGVATSGPPMQRIECQCGHRSGVIKPMNSFGGTKSHGVFCARCHRFYQFADGVMADGSFRKPESVQREPVTASASKPLRETKDGKLHLPVLLTASRMSAYRTCNLKHYYAYVLQVRPVRASEPLTMGTWFHVALEAYWKARKKSWPDVTRDALSAAGFEAMRALDKIAEAEGTALDRTMWHRVRVMVAAYMAKWNQRTNVEPLAIEQSFKMPLEKVGKDGKVQRSNFWMLSGKIDLIVRIDGVVWVVEHKSSAADIDAGSDYRRRLTLDEQISLYLKAARSLGFNAEGIIYDVTRKSKKKPLLATKEIEYTLAKKKNCLQCHPKSKKAVPTPGPHFDEELGVSCEDGKVVTEAPRPKAGQRLTDETWEEYEQRLVEDGLDSMVEIVEIARFDREMEKFDRTIMQFAQLMRFAIESEIHPPNSDACFKYGGGCDYLPVCSGIASIDDKMLFKKLDTAHPELDEPKAEEIA